MKVEAIKIDEGLLIPMSDEFKDLKQDKVLLEIEILEPLQVVDYSALDQLIGLCETNHTDASLDHDAHIYGRRDDNDL
jgi:hypothetical protein